VAYVAIWRDQTKSAASLARIAGVWGEGSGVPRHSVLRADVRLAKCASGLFKKNLTQKQALDSILGEPDGKSLANFSSMDAFLNAVNGDVNGGEGDMTSCGHDN
jgi:hypothetical protein